VTNGEWFCNRMWTIIAKYGLSKQALMARSSRFNRDDYGPLCRTDIQVIIGCGLTCFPIMEFPVNFFKLWVGDVGIDLGGGNIFVPQHFLDSADISSG